MDISGAVLKWALASRPASVLPQALCAPCLLYRRHHCTTYYCAKLSRTIDNEPKTRVGDCKIDEGADRSNTIASTSQRNQVVFLWPPFLQQLILWHSNMTLVCFLVLKSLVVYFKSERHHLLQSHTGSHAELVPVARQCVTVINWKCKKPLQCHQSAQDSTSSFKVCPFSLTDYRDSILQKWFLFKWVTHFQTWPFLGELECEPFVSSKSPFLKHLTHVSFLFLLMLFK